MGTVLTIIITAALTAALVIIFNKVEVDVRVKLDDLPEEGDSVLNRVLGKEEAIRIDRIISRIDHIAARLDDDVVDWAKSFMGDN